MSLSNESTMGTKISLLSNSMIRYEGYLCGLDQDMNTVSLSNVRILGTEGRKAPAGDVAPSPQIFELIVFRGSDIHDLTVFENSQTPASVDPAILSVTSGGAGNAPLAAVAVGAGVPQAKTLANVARPPVPAAAAPVPVAPAHGFYDQPQARPGGFSNGNMSTQPFHQQSNSGGRYQGAHGGRGGYNRRGGHGGRGRGSGHYRRNNADAHTGMDFLPVSEGKKEGFKEDFDFEKARQEFEQNKKEFQEAKEEAKQHHKVYDKSSFFDNISGDQKDRGASRMNRDEMKKADTETFGSEMVGRMNPGGGYRGRGGRGGRGRYQRY